MLYVIYKPRRGSKAMKAAVELHLFALFLLLIGAAVLFLAEPTPPTMHVLYLSLSAYATAILCVATGQGSRPKPPAVVFAD